MFYYRLFSIDDSLGELGGGVLGNNLDILILSFFPKVCDVYISYNLPLVVLFPPGIFYSALLSLDSSILNQLCYIMHRYEALLPFYKLVYHNSVFIFNYAINYNF